MARKPKPSSRLSYPAFRWSSTNWVQLGLIIFVLVMIAIAAQQDVLPPSSASTNTTIYNINNSGAFGSTSTTPDDVIPSGWTILESTDPKQYPYYRIWIATNEQGQRYAVYSQQFCSPNRGMFGVFKRCTWSNRFTPIPQDQTLYEAFPTLDPNFDWGDSSNTTTPPAANQLVNQQPVDTPSNNTTTTEPTIPSTNTPPVLDDSTSSTSSWLVQLQAWFNQTRAKFQTYLVGQSKLPWYCKIFRNLSSCKKLADELTPPTTQDFLNQDGERVTFAALAFANIFHNRARGVDAPYDSATVKNAMDTGSMTRDPDTDDPIYLPYQDENYDPIYYYRCGPFDLVGTLTEIERDCLVAPRGPDEFPIFDVTDGYHRDDGYIFNQTNAIKLDIQTNDRTKFVDNQPPFVFKFGDYVYGDDDPRIQYLPYLSAYQEDTDSVRLVQFDPAVTTASISSKYTVQFRNVTLPADWQTLQTAAAGSYQAAGGLAKTSWWRYEGEWIRYGGHDVRQVFDVELTPKLIEQPPILYARYGDTIRFYTRYQLNARIGSQPIYAYTNEPNQTELDQLPLIPTEAIASNIFDSLLRSSEDTTSLLSYLNQQLIQGRIYTDSSTHHPPETIADLIFQQYPRAYEYQVQFLSGYSHRVQYGATLANGAIPTFDLNPGPDKTFGYLMMEPSTPDHTITCLDPTAGVGLTDYFARLQVQQYECTPRKNSPTAKSYIDEGKSRL